MNCNKCGKLIGHGTMGTVVPLCQCQWEKSGAINHEELERHQRYEYFKELMRSKFELESKLAASEEARKEVVRERDELKIKLESLTK